MFPAWAAPLSDRIIHADEDAILHVLREPQGRYSELVGTGQDVSEGLVSVGV